jgi:hypothetical protein
LIFLAIFNLPGCLEGRFRPSSSRQATAPPLHLAGELGKTTANRGNEAQAEDGGIPIAAVPRFAIAEALKGAEPNE